MNKAVVTKESITKDLKKYIIFLVLLLASPFVTCGPHTVKVDTLYSRPLMYHVVYFKKDKDHNIVFGEKSLGTLGTYRVSGFSLYDKSGKKVGTIVGGFNSATVDFYDNMFNGELNGDYSIDH